MILRLLSILLMLAIGGSSLSQGFDTKDFRLYTLDQGLTDNKIVGIVQDSTGYIWIATQHGLNRFDGNIFKPFLKTSRYNPIPDNAVFSMKLLGNRLAIATDNGAQLISTTTLEHTNLNVPTEEALSYWANACRYISADDKGNYGLSTKTGFYVFSNQGKLKKRFDYYTQKDIGHAWMMFGSKLHQLPDGNLMQQNSEGLLVYDGNKNIIQDIDAYYPALKNVRPLLNNRQLLQPVSRRDLLLVNVANNSFDLIDIRTGDVRSFSSCFNLLNETGWQTSPTPLIGNTWVINSRGKGFFLLQIDTNTRTISCLPKRYFSDHFCSTVFRDRSNHLWIGTDKGLYMQTMQPGIVKSFTIDSLNRDRHFSITSVLISGDKIFAGTDSKAVLIIDKKAKKIVQRIQLERHQVLANAITGFVWLNPDTLLVSSSSGLHWLNTKNLSNGKLFADRFREFSSTITFLFSDHHNNIWILNNSIDTIYFFNRTTRKLERIDDKNEELLKINKSNSVAQDNKGNIWFGGDAIARWNVNLGKIDTLIEKLPTQKNRKKGFFVVSDSRGEIWTVLNDDGFARITNGPAHLRPENLLLDYTRTYPTALNDKIFMATNNGLGYLDLRSFKGVILHHAEGVPQKPITTFQFTGDPADGSTWFAAENILCNLPASGSNYYGQAPTFTVSDVAVINDTLINYPKDIIRLGPNQNDIRVTVSAINFIDPENMRFAYRINNERDSSWIEAGTQPNILLTNISPGAYKLQVKLYAYDNKWPEQIREIQFSIRPPFWKTWWFRAVIALAIIAAIYSVYISRISEVRKKARIDKLMAEYEIKALHAQMNPHFIFNCLNSIREMILENENQQASHYLSKFAHLIRLTLNNSSRPFINLQNTIDYLRRYLEMEQIRKSDFSYHIEVDEAIQAEDLFLPPMLIQPFIENAIWHGASTFNEPIEISIHFLAQNNQLVCVVEDNGVGIQASLKTKYNQQELQTEHHSLGIENVKQRIHVLNEKYNLHSRVTIEDKSNLPAYSETGTLVTLYLPMKNSEL